MTAELIVEDFLNAIRKRIEANEEIANDLAHDLAKKELPCLDEIQARYNALGEVTEGLNQAIDIIITQARVKGYV